MSSAIIKEKIRNYLAQNDFKLVRSLVLDLDNYELVEHAVFAILESQTVNLELLDFVLNHFLSTRKNSKPAHGYWVHSLSHFIPKLWQIESYDWIKKLYIVAFTGACELQDPNCSIKLVLYFLEYRKYDTKPSDFGINNDSTAWINLSYYDKEKIELENSPFESQEALLRFQLNSTMNIKSADYKIQQLDVVNTDKFESILKQLQDEGIDITEFNPLKVELYTKRLQNLIDLRGKVREECNEALELKIQEAEQKLAEIF
jgi:hypothetical protein